MLGGRPSPRTLKRSPVGERGILHESAVSCTRARYRAGEWYPTRERFSDGILHESAVSSTRARYHTGERYPAGERQNCRRARYPVGERSILYESALSCRRAFFRSAGLASPPRDFNVFFLAFVMPPSRQNIQPPSSLRHTIKNQPPSSRRRGCQQITLAKFNLVSI